MTVVTDFIMQLFSLGVILNMLFDLSFILKLTTLDALSLSKLFINKGIYFLRPTKYL